MAPKIFKRKSPRAIALGGLAAALCVLWTGCAQAPGGEPVGRLLRRTDCKGSLGLGPASVRTVKANSLECVEYSYDGRGVLLLKHVNAGFNCCPGTVSADIRISAGEIRIRESESSSLCDCSCLYDLDYEFVDIGPGLYRISVVGPYQPSDGPALEFLVDLSGAASGTYCVERTQYPWGY